MILACTCSHEFQDQHYGPFQRVHNYTPKGYSGNPGYRCTVCLNVKAARGPVIKQEKKIDA